VSTNPITGDKLISKPNSKEYESNYDRIFAKPAYIKGIHLPHTKWDYLVWVMPKPTNTIKHWRGFTLHKATGNKRQFKLSTANTKYLYGIQLWIGTYYYSITRDKPMWYRKIVNRE